eukprot:symbB.v1.2.020621.t1/scaffold1747.1/size103332/8
MGERDVKLARLLETIGDGADPDFAREVLMASNWDLQAAITVILGDGVQAAPAPAAPAAPAPLAPVATATASSVAPEGVSRMGSRDVRAPMRTGFYDTLLPTDPAEQARQDKAREEERKRLEAERIAAEERRQREAEEAHNKNLARMAEEQRAAAEKQAIERKKQKVQEEQEALRLRKEKKGRRRDDSDDDLEDIPVASGMMLADLSDQLAGKAESAAARTACGGKILGAPHFPSPFLDEVSSDPVAEMPAVPVETAQEAPALVPEAPPLPPSAPTQEAAEVQARVNSEPTLSEQLLGKAVAEVPKEATKEEPEVPHEAEKAVDPLVLALRELRKKYREADPASLATCYRTLNDVVGNIISHPQETKYQRIKAEKFRSRVCELEGAVAVLEACGFHPDDSNEFLVMDADYARTQGLRLRENKRKVELLISELENAGF